MGFFFRSGAWGRVGRALNVGNPTGLPWTWLCERFVRRADAVTVASRFLQSRFGGTLIPHVRDTDAWDPARYDRAEARARLGVGAQPLVMFLGTPRGYKGVDDLVAAVDRSEEHTSELQSRENVVCRLLLEKKKKAQAEHARALELDRPGTDAFT